MITTSLSRWHSRSSAWRSSISNQATLQQPENAARRMEFTLLITISAYEAKRPQNTRVDATTNNEPRRAA